MINMNIKRSLGNIIYILKIAIKQMKFIIFINILYTIIMGFTPLVILQLTKNIMNIVELKSKEKINTMLILVLLIFLINVMQNIISNINIIVTSLNNIIFSTKFELSIFNKLKKIDICYYDSFKFNELINKVYAGSNSDLSTLLSIIFNIIQSLIILVSYIATLLFTNILIWQKVLIIFSGLIALVYRRVFFNKQNELTIKTFEETNLLERKNKIFNNMFFESNTQDELKVYKAQEYFINKIKNITKELYNINTKSQYKIHNINRIGAIGVYVIQRLVYLILLLDIYLKKISYGEFVLIVGLQEGLFSEVIKLNTYFSSLWEDLYYINYIKEFNSLKETINHVSSNIKEKLECIDIIEFVDVYFKYPDMENYILKGVSFRITKGQKVGIIGANGSGKSTILKLLMRLYDVDSGDILINNQSIKKYNSDDLYKHYSTVFQDFCKYSLTIKEFILFGDPDTELNLIKINKALDLVKMKSFIYNLPKGINTMLTPNFTDESIELSTGQWQKLSLARAYYKDSDVFILDEPSAYLDVFSEKEVLDVLKNKIKEKTIIIVSHNLSATNSCDKIILIDNGKINSQGKHTDLIQSSSLYKDLYFSQASRFQNN